MFRAAAMTKQIIGREKGTGAKSPGQELTGQKFERQAAGPAPSFPTGGLCERYSKITK